MRPSHRALGWALAAGLALLVALRPPDPEGEDARGKGSLARRIAGPFATLAAGVQWTRVDQDLTAGRFARGYARAETALALDPRATAGWTFLARHVVYNRARPQLEPDPRVRHAFLRAGIALLERGEARADEPHELAFEAGLFLVHATAYDDVHGWPGGAAGAWLEAAAHFERAAELGAPLGEAAAARAREEAAALAADPAPVPPTGDAAPPGGAGRDGGDG